MNSEVYFLHSPRTVQRIDLVLGEVLDTQLQVSDRSAAATLAFTSSPSPAASSLVTYKNTILQHLSKDSVDRLRLRQVELPVGRRLEQSEKAIEHVFFLESGVGSMYSSFQDGTGVAVGLFGYESVIGISAFMGVRRSLNCVAMQLPGCGHVARVADARSEFKLGGIFHKLALRYVQMQLTEATQSASCNAKHNVEQRVARWLLLCADRAGSSQMALSQNTLSNMLGVQRTSVALTMGRFKQEALVSYTRGQIRLIDVPRLETRACECYRALKSYRNNYVDV